MQSTYRMCIAAFARRKVNSWQEVSKPMLAITAFLAAIEAFFFGNTVQKLWPAFLHLIDSARSSDLSSFPFLLCIVLMGAVAFQFAYWTFIATGVTAVLRKRVFAV